MKLTAPLSPFVRFIEELYEAEISDQHREATMRTVTFNFPAQDACMLAAIAKRFGKSTAAFGGEVFADHVRELFIALSPEDRRAVAAEADAEQTRYELSKGIENTTNGTPGCHHWAGYADICERVDARDAASIARGRKEEQQALMDAVDADK